MKQIKFHKLVAFQLVIVFLAVASQVSAAEQAKADITGDWLLKVSFDEIQVDAILSLSKDTAGKLTGRWINGWGVTELKDVNYVENKISFVHVDTFRDTESTANFTGRINDDKLSGTLSGQRSISTVEGKRIKPIPAPVGHWYIKTEINEKEPGVTIKGLLHSFITIKANKDGKLTGEWQDGNGTILIIDVNFTQNKLTFSRKITVEGLERVLSYELTVKGDTLSGTAKSQQGERQVEGELLFAALIGKWELTITSERGTRTQILQINRDLSGLYGAIPIDNISFSDNRVGFKFVMQIRDQKVKNEFKGKLEGEKLTGDLTSFGGTTRKVDGKKLGLRKFP